jgi:Photosynthetic reaction centre cytochrome C subunit
MLNQIHLGKKILIYTGIGLFLFTGISSTYIPEQEPAGKNLKVLPKNIDGEQIERLMHKMTHDLGVLCTYCHPFTKPDVFPQRVDFVTDEIPQKNIARKMMVMTDKINRKFFGFKNDYSVDAMNNKKIVSCNTCHRGLPKPNNKLIIPQ